MFECVCVIDGGDGECGDVIARRRVRDGDVRRRVRVRGWIDV